MKNMFLTLAAPVLAGLALAAADPEDLPEKKIDFCRAFPAHIKTVAVISPASMPNQAILERRIAVMRAHGIKVKQGKYIFEKQPGKTEAPLEHRKADFMAAYMDPEVDLVLCTRGGNGAQDLIKVLDWETMRKRPNVPLIGFSNITMITSAMLAKGVGHPFAGPNLSNLGGSPQESIECFRLALEGKDQKPFKLTPVKGGDCSGKTYAGHLVMLNWIDRDPAFRVDPSGCIVFVECVRRPVKELTRNWNELVQRGFFKNVKGVVFCHFTRIKATPEEIQKMLEMFAQSLTCPVYKGFPYGHNADNHSLDLLGSAEIRDNTLYLHPKK